MRTFVIDKTNRFVSELHLVLETDRSRSDLIFVESAPADIGDRYSYINNSWVADPPVVSVLSGSLSAGNKTNSTRVLDAESQMRYDEFLKSI